MTVPQEYVNASAEFEAVLVDVRDVAMLGTTHRSYTTLEAVLKVFRSRLNVQQALDFSNLLSIGLRALFVSDWDAAQPIRVFGSSVEMMKDVMALRPNHNLSTPTAIEDVTRALRRHINEKKLEVFLAGISSEALAFWGFPHGDNSSFTERSNFSISPN